jgi:hypothetical protein
VYGPAHAVPSREEAKGYLEEELAALPSGSQGEPLLDALSDEPALVRLNLRPFVAAGGDRERLLDAFVASAARVHGDPAVMKARLAAAAAVLRELGRGETARQLDVLAADPPRTTAPRTVTRIARHTGSCCGPCCSVPLSRGLPPAPANEMETDLRICFTRRRPVPQ